MLFRRCLPLAYALSFVREGYLTLAKCGYLLRAAGRALAGGDIAGPLPAALVVEPTDACNLNCPGCGYNLVVSKQRTFLATADFRRIVDEAAPGAVALLLYLAGEPFLHPELPACIAYAAARRLAVIVSTNGNFRHWPGWADALVRSRCHTVIFSISGHSQATYAEYHRNGELATVQARVQELLAARRAAGARLPVVTMRYLVTGSPANATDIKPARAFYTGLGVDRFETRQALAQLSTDTTPESAPPSATAATRGPHSCFWLWSIPVVKSNLQVIPCCYEYFGVPQLGSLGDTPLAVLWNSPAYRQFRRRVRQSRPTLPCCRQCHSRPGFQGNAFAAARTVRL
ncbi:MAG TPA: SPASM domain-containing protein [bacterium]|nr:SPASM domain-containing protein [bacterium]